MGNLIIIIKHGYLKLNFFFFKISEIHQKPNSFFFAKHPFVFRKKELLYTIPKFMLLNSGIP